MRRQLAFFLATTLFIIGALSLAIMTARTGGALAAGTDAPYPFWLTWAVAAFTAMEATIALSAAKKKW